MQRGGFSFSRDHDGVPAGRRDDQQVAIVVHTNFHVVGDRCEPRHGGVLDLVLDRRRELDDVEDVALLQLEDLVGLAGSQDLVERDYDVLHRVLGVVPGEAGLHDLCVRGSDCFPNQVANGDTDPEHGSVDDQTADEDGQDPDPGLVEPWVGDGCGRGRGGGRGGGGAGSGATSDEVGRHECQRYCHRDFPPHAPVEQVVREDETHSEEHQRDDECGGPFHGLTPVRCDSAPPILERSSVGTRNILLLGLAAITL